MTDIMLLVPAHFKKEPKDVEVALGGSAYFDCQADGKPLPNISWTDDNLRTLDNPRYTQFTNGTLWIKDVRAEDEAEYYCLISFDLFRKAELIIREPEEDSSDKKISK